MKKILIVLCASSLTLNAAMFTVTNTLKNNITVVIEHDNYVHTGTQIRCDKKSTDVGPNQTKEIHSTQYHGFWSTDECCVNKITIRAYDGKTIKTIDRATLGDNCNGHFEIQVHGDNQVDITKAP